MYIKACMSQCEELSTFKLVLNGFDVADEYMQKVITLIIKALPDRKNISTIWIHTNHLTSCTKNDFIKMLELVG